VSSGWAEQPTPSPDLVVTRITAPFSAAAGESVSLTYAIQNIGQGTAEGSYLGCFLASPSRTIIICSVFLKGLAPGASYSGLVDLLIPEKLPAETYTLTLKADYTNVLRESIETNNTAGQFLVITIPFLTTGQAFLSWNANPDPDIAGYRVYLGTGSHTYVTGISVGNVTNYTVRDLVVGMAYFFAVTAYNIEGIESTFSDEVSKTIGD